MESIVKQCMDKIRFDDEEIRLYLRTRAKLINTSRYDMEYYANGHLIEISQDLLDECRTVIDVLCRLDDSYKFGYRTW